MHPWPNKSTDTVKGVSYAALLACTIRPRSSSSQRDSSKGAQMRPRTMGSHEVDDFGRGMPRGDEEVAFIFAILVIHDDDDFTALDRFDGFWDSVQFGHVRQR